MATQRPIHPLDTMDPSKLMLAEKFMLRKGNWIDWKKQIQTMCKVCSVYGHLDGSIPRPSPGKSLMGATTKSKSSMDESGARMPRTTTPSTTPDAACEKWDTDDSIAAVILTLNIEDFVGEGIDDEGKPAAFIWEKLCAKHERKDVLTMINAE
jgi:hypothetical protein